LTISKYLLDVNVLLALAWPQHQFHPKAAAWFSEHANEGWSTCVVTELGFVRLSSNLAFTAKASSPIVAVQLLKKLTQQGAHSYLKLCVA
jgi:predicted nucleic acid-binding protein